MRIKLTFIIILLSCNSIYSQVRSLNTNNIWAGKEFSKDIALFRAKNFLYREVLGVTEQIGKFELIPLAASGSGELTTLLYRSEENGVYRASHVLP